MDIQLSGVDHGVGFDFGKTSAQYAKYRDIYPPELYDRLLALGVGRPGTRYLDIGTGTGVLPLHLYACGAECVGTDISAEQIAAAKALAAERNAPIRYFACPAEELPFEDGTFDAVTAAQCFWYFDRAKIIPEIRRVLKPGGVFVKIYMNWMLTDPIARASCRLVKRLNPAWTSGATAYRDVFNHPFPDGNVEVFTADIPFTRESWHGRMLACRGTMASMDAQTLRVWDERHRELLQKRPEAFTVRHRIYIVSYVL